MLGAQTLVLDHAGLNFASATYWLGDLDKPVSIFAKRESYSYL